ncbi:hypothetical protein XELAEV_18022446mg [Xenopus laevis]|uniref:Reverse transcriptase domain-containing protein n=1 Tax=Xenopus laevis TaxID=8355 RepID=A0A974HNN8_XENLA|nr:hypothetical protein XELAEV_18022446mg [Xenopus laevis]
MGTHFEPQYSNLFMAKLEEDFLSTCNTKPLTYLRYIDDIFIFWTDTEQELTQFHKQFQDFHPTINLKMSYSPTHIHFLDTNIHIRENTIQLPYIALQYNRICSDTTERYHHLKTLKADFINRGYNPMIVDQYVHAATRIPRTHLLQYKQKPEINRVPQVVTYNPHLRTLRKIARDLQDKLQDERLKSIFPDPPLLAFRQPPNLKSLITRSALLQPTNNGTYPCGKKQCKTCPHIQTSDKIPIPDTLEEYSIHGHYNCSSSNVVYLIQCIKCITGGLYIGETWQSLRKRNKHDQFTITNKKLDTSIGNHFNGPHHSIKDLRILVLKGNF